MSEDENRDAQRAAMYIGGYIACNVINKDIEAKMLAGLDALESRIAQLTAERDSARRERDEAVRSCPCRHTTPCHERCTCVSPVSSSGCRRCCAYGSNEQRRAAAERIALSDTTVASLRAALAESCEIADEGWRALVDDPHHPKRGDLERLRRLAEAGE